MSKMGSLLEFKQVFTTLLQLARGHYFNKNFEIVEKWVQKPVKNGPFWRDIPKNVIDSFSLVSFDHF